MGQRAHGNHTSLKPAGMKLIGVMPHYHPTLAEIWTYPAEELAGENF
jgi:hypothetical protein